ncbi:MAG TPA: hypothetical protein VGM54_19665 [Chthoniobacter sp.]|jgi:hypothetical protein
MSGTKVTPVLAKKWQDDEPPLPSVADLGVARAVEVVDAYYDSNKKEFLIRNTAGRWLSHPAWQFQMLLTTAGIARSKLETEAVMVETINTRDVHYTGSLAGHRAGFYDANGVRMLVTESPRLLTPAPGEWPMLRQLIYGLLGADEEHGEVQVQTFFYWLWSGHESISTGHWRPAQILALAGPADCGKSLLQRLITECFGGRAADPFRYLSGGTEFNRELFGAEHLVVDDAQASTDFRTRLQMAANLKSLAVGRDHNCHGKGRDAVNLRPLWRCTVSLNDEGECLLVLPPLRADIADKIHLLKCFPPSSPFPTDTPAAMADYWERLRSELPALLTHCRTVIPPPGRENTRFGIRAFHHPALVLALEEQAPEVVLLELVDLELWESPLEDSWEGTAQELETRLLGNNSKVREQARRLLTWAHACGTYLGRLAKNQPERVEEGRTAKKRGWIIKKPRQ